MDMTTDIFAEQSYGKAALKKMGDVPATFRLFMAGWLGNSDTMEVKGAEFRKALSGKNKGMLTVLVKGTGRTAYVTVAEMKMFEENV
jgi:hypothetical protein